MSDFKTIKNLDKVWEEKAYRGDGKFVPLTDEYRDIIHGEYNNIKESANNNISIEYSDTVIEMPLNEMGMRALRTVYGDWETLQTMCPDVNIPWNNNFSNRFANDSDDISGFETILDENLFKEIVLPLIALHFWLRDNLENYRTYTIEDVMDGRLIENVEIRAWLLSESRELDLAEYLGEVHTYVNPRNNGVYTLFRGDIMDTAYNAVRCYCPSTDRRFFLPVKDGFETAQDAIASLVRIPEGLHQYVHEIKRQGEKFPVTWTIPMDSDEFKEARNTPLKALNGEEYFEKLVDET